MTKGENNKENNKGKFLVGLDLGTTNSCMCMMRNGTPYIIETPEGERTFKSMVSFRENGETAVGREAENEIVTNPESVIFSHKSAMGQTTIPESMKNRNYKTEIVNGKIAFNIPGVGYKSPSQCAAVVLMKVKEYVKEATGKYPDGLVVTCPAHFDQGARNQIKDAGMFAGVDIVRIINEPTAAAIAYGMNHNFAGNIFVLDLGGGTFDASVLEIEDGSIEVKATGGDGALGGDDFDQKLVDYMMTRFKQQHPRATMRDDDGLFRIKQEAQMAKHKLSNSPSATFAVNYIGSDEGGTKQVHLNGSVSVVQFESMIEGELAKMRGVIDRVLRDAKLQPQDIDKVLLVGGSTRVPAVKKLAENIFGRGKIERGINPDEVVATGAAVQAGILSGEKGTGDILLLDVTPLSIGIETQGGVFTKIIERNSTIPTQKSQVFSTAADNQNAVTIHVLQGERQFAQDNKTMGQFTLGGIAPAPRGVPQIEVSFNIDANGIVHVSAKDKKTGKSQEITISDANSMSDEEIEKMKKDAEKNAEADKKRKDIVMAKTNGEMTVYNAEKLLKERTDLEGNEILNEVREAIKELNTSIASEDIEKINAATKVLGEKISKLPPKPEEKKEEKK
jgi:molecular chaperone DnaK